MLRAWLGLLEDGQLASPRCGLAVPRQNGKNALIEVVDNENQLIEVVVPENVPPA